MYSPLAHRRGQTTLTPASSFATEPPSPSRTMLSAPHRLPGYPSGLHVPRSLFFTQPRSKPSSVAPETPSPASSPPRSRAPAMAPPRPERPNLPGRPISDGRPGLDLRSIEPESLDLDPTDQIRRYPFGPDVLLKSPCTLEE